MGEAMKPIKVLILLILFSSININAKFTPKPLAEKPKYILFDNLEAKNFVDSAYWIYLSDPTYVGEVANYAIRKPFSETTLQQYKLTDFDVAIFLLGDNKLNVKVGNASVLDAIRQMIKANKNVLIIGRNVLWYAFNPSSPDKDPAVQKFLTDTLGIEYLTRMKVSRQDGNQITYWSFNVRGAFGDPVGQSVIKWCNMGFRPNPNEVWWPLAIYLEFDVFKSRDKDNFPPTDHFIRTNNDYPNDTIVGIRSEIGQARICFWSIGFEAFAGDIPRGYQLARAINWLKGNIAPETPAFDVDPLVVEFGEVELGKSTEVDLTITSTGLLDLVIDEIDIWDNPDDVYQIIEGAISKPITLKRGQTHKIKIRFTPKEEKEYRGQLSIKSNVQFSEYRYIDLWGYGGRVAMGPVLKTNYETEINFGKVMKGFSRVDTLELQNIGDQQLVIYEFEIDTTFGDWRQFDIAQTISRPIYIDPGKSVKIRLRFSATSPEERIYQARLKIVHNAKENNQVFINLVGEIIAIGNVEAAEAQGVRLITFENTNKFKIICENSSCFAENTTFELFDTFGRKIVDAINFVASSNDEIIFEVNQPTGVYYLAINTKSNKTVIPILIVN